MDQEDFEQGPDLFEQLPEKDQRHILGPGKFEAYKAGRIRLQDLAGERRDPRWGLVGYERSLKEALAVRHTVGHTSPGRGERGMPYDPEVPLHSLGAAASLQAVRRVQLQQMDPTDILAILDDARQSTLAPAPLLHQRHFAGLGVADEAGYQAAFRQHLQRDDLRAFTYIRSNGKVPLWELVAPDTGATMMYNEKEKKAWSFFQPRNAIKRMVGMLTLMVEIIDTARGLQFEDQWKW